MSLLQDLRQQHRERLKRLAAAAKRPALRNVPDVVIKKVGTALPECRQVEEEPDPGSLVALVRQVADETAAIQAQRKPESLPPGRRPTVDDIKKLICATYGITLLEIDGRARQRRIMHPRLVAQHLCYTLTNCSLTFIGRRFGQRDHTTVLSGHRKMTHLRAAHPAIEAELQALALKLGVVPCTS